MTNFKVYKKTLSFSFLIFVVDLLTLLVVVGSATAGFFIANQATDMAILGLFIGLVIGIILASLIGMFVTNRFKAAQISMIAKGVADGELPEHTFKAGFAETRGRFGRIAAFFLIDRAIKGIFRQVSHTINRIGTAVGGDVGNSVTSAVNTAVEILIGYLCDCCLGWIMYRKDINPFKAGCEGAVIFFRHGKTLMKNVGRIFGMGFLSLALVGGGFFGIFLAIFLNFPNMFVTLGNEILEIFKRMGETAPSFISDPTLLTVVACAILGIVLWSIIHSVLIRPFILVGVMRNYMEAGKAHIPTEAEFGELASKSPKFAKLQAKAQGQ